MPSEKQEEYEMDEESAVKQKLNPEVDSASPSKVKFLPAGDGTNGDAVIKVENGIKSSGGVGMNKEELMKYANDPFWVRLRMFLFVLFWVVWFAMLIGSVLIIAFAPRCAPSSSLKWWQKSTIYQIYVRSFKDSNDDGVGDIRGIIDKLDYIKDTLGVNTILLSPIYASPMKDYGYDVTDFTAIDPSYGNLTDFEDLIKAKNERKMKLIIDFIPNHTSDKHPWFIESENNSSGKYADYYVWRNASGIRSPPNNWVSVFGGSAWKWSDKRNQYYLHQFYDSQPDLNYRNPEVVNEINNVLKFWFDYDVDGVRIDAVSHLYESETFADESRGDDYGNLNHDKTKGQPENLQLLKEWRNIVKKKGSDNIIITEAYESIESVLQYYGSVSDPLADMTFNFHMISDVRQSNLNRLKNFIELWYNSIERLNWTESKSIPWTAWVTGNHDNSRLATRFGELSDAVQMVAFLTPRSTPVVYYGDEIGMTDTLTLATDDKRLAYRGPMQWSANATAGFSNAIPWVRVNENYLRTNVEEELSSNSSHLSIFKALVNLRNDEKTQNTLLLGDLHFPRVNTSDTVFVMARTLSGYNGYLVVANLERTLERSQQNVSLKESYLPETGKVIIASGNSQHSIGSQVNLTALDLARFESLVVELPTME